MKSLMITYMPCVAISTPGNATKKLYVSSSDSVLSLKTMHLIIVSSTQWSRLVKSLSSSLNLASRLHNAFSPVDRLPPEVMTHIFMLLTEEILDELRSFPCEEEPLFADDDWDTEELPGLIHVCQRRRHIILHSPALWATMFIDGHSNRRGKRHTRFCLKHSGRSPLRVYGSHTPWNVFPLLSAQSHRFQAVRFSRPTRASLHLFQQPAPLLECLDIEYPGRTGWPKDHVDEDIVVPILFNNEMPRLRYLTLDWASS